MLFVFGLLDEFPFLPSFDTQTIWILSYVSCLGVVFFFLFFTSVLIWIGNGICQKENSFPSPTHLKCTHRWSTFMVIWKEKNAAPVWLWIPTVFYWQQEQRQPWRLKCQSICSDPGWKSEVCTVQHMPGRWIQNLQSCLSVFLTAVHARIRQQLHQLTRRDIMVMGEWSL